MQPLSQGIEERFHLKGLGFKLNTALCASDAAGVPPTVAALLAVSLEA